MFRAEMRADGVRGELPQPLVNALKGKEIKGFFYKIDINIH